MKADKISRRNFLTKSSLAMAAAGAGQVQSSACNFPHNIPVNTIMRYHHYYLGQGREKYAMQKYSEISGPKLDKCRDCAGYCESACPYGVSIKDLLAIAYSDLGFTGLGLIKLS